MTDDDAAPASRLGAARVADPGGGQGAAVAAALARSVAGPCSSSTPTSRASRRTTCARCCAATPAGGLASSRPRTGRRTRSRCPTPRALRAALRARAAPSASARTRAWAPSRSGRAPEPRRRRRHARTISPRARPRRAEHAGRARVARPRRVKVVVLSGRRRRRALPARARRGRRPGDALTIVGNVGDDLEVLGLHVSPDLDTILYALAGPRRRGARLGARGRDVERARDRRRARRRGWFRLGDRDLGLHLVRTAGAARAASRSRRSRPGSRPRSASSRGCSRRPTTALRTWLETPAGAFPFQEWFVARGHRDEVDGVRFEGAEAARPRPGVLEALDGADLILIAPSNPYVSIGPILAVERDPRGARAAPRPVRRRQPARSAAAR